MMDGPTDKHAVQYLAGTILWLSPDALHITVFTIECAGPDILVWDVQTYLGTSFFISSMKLQILHLNGYLHPALAPPGLLRQISDSTEDSLSSSGPVRQVYGIDIDHPLDAS